MLLLFLFSLLVFILSLRSSASIFYYLNTSWRCCVTVFLDCFETLSREVLKNRNQHNRRDACVLLFYREEYALSSEPKKKKHTQKKAKHKPAFSVGELLFVILKRERCTEEKSSIFATKVTVLFLQHGFEILQTFQKL